jgi:hypothetical protein
VCSPDDVSSAPCGLLFLLLEFSFSCFPLAGFDEKIRLLGTECVEFLKVVQASRGKPLFYVVSSACLMYLSMVSYSPSLSLFYTADALTVVNARIASLEAELNASS